MRKKIEDKLKTRKKELLKTNEIIGGLQQSLNRFTKQKIGLEYMIVELESLLKEEKPKNPKKIKKEVKND